MKLSITECDARFRIACETGNLDEAQRLAQNYNLNARLANAGKCEPLLWACENGHLKLAQWLTGYFQLNTTIAHGKSTRTCKSAINAASKKGHLEVIRWLAAAYKLPPNELPQQIVVLPPDTTPRAATAAINGSVMPAHLRYCLELDSVEFGLPLPLPIMGIVRQFAFDYCPFTFAKTVFDFDMGENSWCNIAAWLNRLLKADIYVRASSTHRRYNSINTIRSKIRQFNTAMRVL